MPNAPVEVQFIPTSVAAGIWRMMRTAHGARRERRNDRAISAPSLLDWTQPKRSSWAFSATLMNNWRAFAALAWVRHTGFWIQIYDLAGRVQLALRFARGSRWTSAHRCSWLKRPRSFTNTTR